MKGSITKYRVKRKSRPKWRYRIYLGKDDQGKKVYAGKGGFDKETDAAEAMRRQIGALRVPVEASPQKAETLGFWLSVWLERYRQLASYILESSEGAISAAAETLLSQLSHSQIETALCALLRAKARRRKHLSTRTIRHVGGLLNVALNKAFRLGMILVNPMLRVELPRVETSDVCSLTIAEILSLRETCRGDWTFALVETALATGGRRGELLALRWSDLNWMTGALIISKSLEQTADGLRIKAT
jgi:integrase